MGTRYEDQPAEHWAGPESLDPTPVWKQYVLIALLLALGLVVVLIVAITALAPQFVTPPAMVPGDRLVLSATSIDSGEPSRPVTDVRPPVVDASHSLWVVRVDRQYVAIRARWAPRSGDAECAVSVAGATLGFAATCPDQSIFLFTATGEPKPASGAAKEAPRGLDRYLVSVSGDRVIVNLSRVIESSERTNAPVPTGIPQPQATP